MRARIILALLFVTMLAYGQEAKKNTEGTPSQESISYVENEFIIWLEQGVDAASFAARSNETIAPKELLSKDLNIWLFEIKGDVKHRDLIMQNLSRNGDIRHIQNNHTNISMRDVTPDDTYYNQQWAPAKMQLPKAWDEYTTGGLTALGDTIVVAVIDGGVFLNHQDLNLWKNRHETPGNGIDDDGNGYIDDYHGWNAYTNNGNIISDSHGTHVAGIVGAIGNNGKGVAGVNWAVKVLPIRGSSGTESIVVKAYSYVLAQRKLYNETNGEKGAFIVASNSSFGIDYANPNNYPIWCSMYDEMGKQGILSAAAGPNRNVNVDQVGDVPSTCASLYMLGVTNTTNLDQKYVSAGYGTTHIDIGAPGTNIYSTMPNNAYANNTGTSMATPQVAGVIALMYAAMPKNMIESCKADPAAFALKVREFLLEGADELASLNNLVAGKRRLNAYGAIQKAVAYGNSVDEVLSDNDVSIFPNPTVGELRVQGGVDRVEVLDAAGKSVGVYEMAGKNQDVINISHLPTGVYLVKMNTSKGEILKKVVKE